ncbi:MAG: NAD-dependent epimerase/dehydratase family protein [Xanthomonadales bacterium]|nr:NAD-dependent epimerase/dehydratase family protein [Gammaproteobacteria bacterium]MBT8055169.1 NAD-dependent epimerase/dehydratase family protein [Gammaproteobacteria bacterium]NNK52841.1 NAD-dependent epimerase/dehydratase family protein [Xanthomonadales bacterium]
MTTRREFLTVSAGALALQASGLAAVVPATRPLDILFLGGTGFLGPHQINYAVARGHRVTMFNRGSNSGMYGDAVEELVGNRDPKIDSGLSVLQGDRTWDVVVDNSGYVPRHVRASAELLKGRCKRYIYISTVAVYDFDAGISVFPESAKLADLDDPAVEEVTGETYGPLKAECDRIARDILGGNCTVVRPTYVVGPGDHTDRFTYYVDRVNRGGEVLAPGRPEVEAQWVDARDLCPWIVTLAENDTSGIFNAAGPSSPVDRTGLMWGLRALTAEPVNFYWPDQALLSELDISMPMMSAERASTHFVNTASMEAGLHYRSLADTALGTLEWWQSQSAERRANPRRWPSAGQEHEAIERLRLRAGGDPV